MTLTAISFTALYFALFIVQSARRKTKSAKCLAVAVMACLTHQAVVHYVSGSEEVLQRMALFLVAGGMAYTLDYMKSKACIFSYGLMLFTLFMSFDAYYSPNAVTAAYIAYPFVIIMFNIAILSALMTEKENGRTAAIFDVASWLSRTKTHVGANKK